MSTRFKILARLSNRNAPVIVLFSLLVLGSGCSVSKQRVDIRSDPTDAFVYVNGRFVGNSPTDVKLNRQVPHRVEIRKPGFVSDEVMLYPSYDGDERPAVIFGPFQEAGLYRDLSPNPVELTLLYEGLAGAPDTLTPEEASLYLRQIQTELEAGEMTEAEASFAESQVLSRVEE